MEVLIFLASFFSISVLMYSHYFVGFLILTMLVLPLFTQQCLQLLDPVVGICERSMMLIFATKCMNLKQFKGIFFG